MSLEKYFTEKTNERLISIKKFDGKLSLYFISNTDNKAGIKLMNQTSFTYWEKRIENYEVLLKKYRMKFENLLDELEAF